MDPVTKALSDIKNNIPRGILETVFRAEYGRGGRAMNSLDQNILIKVINSRVVVDCSLMGGDEVHLPLTNAVIEEVDAQTIILRYPKSATNDRSILTVLGVEFSNPQSTAWLSPMVGVQQGPHTLQLSKMMVDVHAPVPTTFTSRVTLIAENTIALTGFTAPPANFVLRCILEYNARMSSMNPRYFHHFSTLAVFATKAYIFNNYELEMAEAQLSGGRELGKFNDIVSRYEDANQSYEDYLKEKWQKISFMNDQPSYHQLWRMMTRGV